MINLRLLDKTTREEISSAHRLLCEPKQAVDLSDPQIRARVEKIKENEFAVTLRAKRLALFVALEAEGLGATRLSDNGFVLSEGERTVTVAVEGDGVTVDDVKDAISVRSYYNK